MAFKIPQPIVMLSQPLSVLPSLSYSEPREGKRIIPVELDWTGNGATFQVNVQGVTTQTFSQIIMLDVDNTQSGADVTFYFPDTADTLVVPAYSGGLFPVFTGQVQFYASAPAALAVDLTRIRILNYRQDPVSNPGPQFHNVATVANAVVGTTAIIPAGVSGTLAGYSVFAAPINAAVGQAQWGGALKDHATGATIDTAFIVLPVSGSFNGLVMNVENAAIRFASGIDFVIANTGAALNSANASITLRYRTP